MIPRARHYRFAVGFVGSVRTEVVDSCLVFLDTSLL